MFVTGWVLHQMVIFNKQKYKVKRKSSIKRIENGIELVNHEEEEEVVIQRRLSKLIDDMNSQTKFSESKFFTINGIKKEEKIKFEKVKTIY